MSPNKLVGMNPLFWRTLIRNSCCRAVPAQISFLQSKALVPSTRPDLLKHFPRARKISILARMCLFWESSTQRKKEKLSFPGDQAGLKAMKVAKAPKIRNRSALTSARILILGSQGAGHKRSRQHPCSSGSFGRTSTVLHSPGAPL